MSIVAPIESCGVQPRVWTPCTEDSAQLPLPARDSQYRTGALGHRTSASNGNWPCETSFEGARRARPRPRDPRAAGPAARRRTPAPRPDAPRPRPWAASARGAKRAGPKLAGILAPAGDHGPGAQAVADQVGFGIGAHDVDRGVRSARSARSWSSAAARVMISPASSARLAIRPETTWLSGMRN